MKMLYHFRNCLIVSHSIIYIPNLGSSNIPQASKHTFKEYEYIRQYLHQNADNSTIHKYYKLKTKITQIAFTDPTHSVLWSLNDVLLIMRKMSKVND